jgi:hypothetical protein
MPLRTLPMLLLAARRLVCPIACLMGLALLLPSARALGEPVDLSDPSPRWVAVSVDRSPEVGADRQDADFSPWLPGWLAPEPGAPARLRVRVDGALVEQHLFGGQDLRKGSFSDYALLLDAATGHVLEASYTGVVSRRLQIGPLRLSREVELRASMTTLASAGYEAPRDMLGEVVLHHCQTAAPGCTLVVPAPYDPATGLLHAVGALEGRSGPFRAHLFAPFGQVRLQEMAPEESEPSFAVFP